MTQNYEICRGETTDIETIVQFQIAMAMESEGTALDREKVRKGVTSAMKDDSKGTYFVARRHGQAIGSMMLTLEWSDWNNGWYWWIQGVYVMPEHRQAGVFKAMYTYLKEAAKEQGIPEIRLYVDKTNIKAQNAYHKLGMQESHYMIFEDHINK